MTHEREIPWEDCRDDCSDVDYANTKNLYYRLTHEGLPVWKLGPSKPGDVGMDLPVRIKDMEVDGVGPTTLPDCEYFINYLDGWVDIPAHGYAEIPAGLHVKIPDDAWGVIKPRSSTGWKKRLDVFEGVIDSNYVGQLKCLVFNPGNSPVRVHDGDRLAQLIIIKKYNLSEIVLIRDLPDTVRGESGFGSSGS